MNLFKFKARGKNETERLIADIDALLTPKDNRLAVNPLSERIPVSMETMKAVATGALSKDRYGEAVAIFEKAQGAWIAGYDAMAGNNPETAKEAYLLQQEQFGQKLVDGTASTDQDLWTLDDWKQDFRQRSLAGRATMDRASAELGPFAVELGEEVLLHVARQAEALTMKEVELYQSLHIEFEPSRLTRVLRSLARSLRERLAAWRETGTCGKPADVAELLGIVIKLKESELIAREKEARRKAGAARLDATVAQVKVDKAKLAKLREAFTADEMRAKSIVATIETNRHANQPDDTGIAKEDLAYLGTFRSSREFRETAIRDAESTVKRGEDASESIQREIAAIE